jgi:hypothetical protein
MSRKAFSIVWGKDGVPVASKNAPALVKGLIDKGHFRQKPLQRVLTPRQLRSKRLAEAKLVSAKDNPYGVMPEQVWEDVDLRNRDDAGTLRRVKIIALCWSEKGHFALAENLARQRRSFINLRQFTVRGKKGFRRIDA